MCQIILDKLFVKFQQFLKMEHLKLPVFLNTLEKYNEMIRTTDTVKKYEEVFYKLLGDESLPLLDILTLMRCIERECNFSSWNQWCETSIGINRIIHQIHDFYVWRNW